MKKATFRVDSSTKIGAGHLLRCLTIADELKKCGYEVTFICRNLSGNLISLINYKVIILPRNDNFESNDLYKTSINSWKNYRKDLEGPFSKLMI